MGRKKRKSVRSSRQTAATHAVTGYITLDMTRPAIAGPAAGRRSRRSAVEGRQQEALGTVLSDAIAIGGLTVVGVRDVPVANARRAAGMTDTMSLRLLVADDDPYVIAVRHASGAITFHAPQEQIPTARRGASGRGRSANREMVFDVSSPSINNAGGERRGVVTKVIKAIVLRVATKLVDRALPRLAERYESRAWKNKGLSEGWYRVSTNGVASAPLTRAELDRALALDAKALLLIHGTFSSAATFAPLTAGHNGFLQRVAPLYGDRIFAYNHFTVSKTPLENALELVSALPSRVTTFDVITHSRGGLVLRTLAENASALGVAGARFKLARGILVASPNEGTPLATPSRWEATVGWFANLLELFPENPFTFGIELVAEGINWIAGRATGSLPGLASMDAFGKTISALQGTAAPAPAGYAALAANFHPSESVLARMADAGLDAFFAVDNDLVVPTRGGWSVRSAGARFIAADRVGCFGVGGNIAQADGGRVYHTNFFSQPETTDFLVNFLTERPMGLPLIELEQMAGRRAALAAVAEAVSPVAISSPVRTAPSAPSIAPLSRMAAEAAVPASLTDTSMPLGVAVEDVLQIVILPPPNEKSPASILATYGSARVHEVLHTSGANDGAGKRWCAIIETHEAIRDYVTGKPDATLPTDAKLIDWGIQMFAALFPGSVRRLYDDARARVRKRRMTVVFTSMIPWIADKPWEFAYDPTRRTHLATEEIHFVRNVLTAVPAEDIDPVQGPLRILVAAAQPVGMGRLSIDQEIAVIRRGFEPLIESGRAVVEVLASATPADLHSRVSRVGSSPFDVVHLIAHGEFDKTTQSGFLLFQDRNGAVHKVGIRELREILCSRSVRLVFLNACDTGQGGLADFNSGVAPALVAAGMPAVIANQYKVLDISATVFAQHFYWSLAQGFTIGAAAREARIAVNYSLSGEAIDWAIPVLYARDATMRLCAPIEGRSPVAPLVTLSGRRSTAGHLVRVAVWDVSYLFPNLNHVLQRMNQSQSRFGFESVDLSVPLGALQMRQVGKQRKLYLHADEAAKKLAAWPAQLGVDYLACLVGMPMMSKFIDEKLRLGIYGWCNADRFSRILMFSVANLGLEPDGEATQRGIANSLVGLLALTRHDVTPHRTGPKTCPLFRNLDRDVKVITGSRSFDSDCRKKICKTSVADLEAFEAILAEFSEKPGAGVDSRAGSQIKGISHGERRTVSLVKRGH